MLGTAEGKLLHTLHWILLDAVWKLLYCTTIPPDMPSNLPRKHSIAGISINNYLLMIAVRNQTLRWEWRKASSFILCIGYFWMQLMNALYCTVTPPDMPSTFPRKHGIAQVSITNYLLMIAGRNQTLRWEQQRANSFILCIGYFWMQPMNVLWPWAMKENLILHHLHIYSRLQP